VWINADVLPGPGGKATPLDPHVFLQEAKGKKKTKKHTHTHLLDMQYFI